MACREEFPHLDALYRDLKDDGFAVVAVDVRNDRANTETFYDDGGFEIPTVFDTRNVAVDGYRVAGTPTTFLVDSGGRIVWRRYGYLPGEEARLRARVEELLGRSSEEPAEAGAVEARRDR